MTPDQLERAARHYCKLMGVDPEQIIMDEAAFYVPRWMRAAQDLKHQWAMNEALNEGMRDPLKLWLTRADGTQEIITGRPGQIIPLRDGDTARWVEAP